VEQSAQSPEEQLELVTLDYDQPRAHQGVENGREEEHVEDEGGQVAPHPQKVDELHQIHRRHGQDEGELPPVGARSGVQNGQVAPHSHIGAHQANILDFPHFSAPLSTFYFLFPTSLSQFPCRSTSDCAAKC